MIYRDTTGVAVAVTALVLTGGVWIADMLRPSAESGLLDSSRSAVLESQPAGTPAYLPGPVAGTQAIITPAVSFADTNGLWCRHYRVETANSGKSGGMTSTDRVACRDAAGEWITRANVTEEHRFDRWLARLTMTPGPQVAAEQ